MIPPWLGALSLLPLVVTVLALNVNSLPFEYMAGAAIASSLLLSVWYSAIGFSERVSWMAVWVLAFVVLVPFANIVFWLIYGRRKRQSQAASGSA
jgi:hypothetical protein